MFGPQLVEGAVGGIHLACIKLGVFYPRGKDSVYIQYKPLCADVHTWICSSADQSIYRSCPGTAGAANCGWPHFLPTCKVGLLLLKLYVSPLLIKFYNNHLLVSLCYIFTFAFIPLVMSFHLAWFSYDP